MRVTIKEIAKELGISHSTVSRVLNDKPSTLVSEATRARITQAAKRMGYRPNRIAQALKGDSTQLIGVFLPDGNDYFFQDVLANLRRVVEHSGFELLLFASSGEKIADKWLRLLRWDLDGVFVFDYMFYTEALQEALSEHSGYIPPMVGLFNGQSHLRDYVAINFDAAMDELLTHFHDRGCRQIAYMAIPTSFHPEEERFASYTRFMQRHELTTTHIALPEAQSLCEAARQAMFAFIDKQHDDKQHDDKQHDDKQHDDKQHDDKQHDDKQHDAEQHGKRYALPDAIFCQNDETALGAYCALRERGISVPDTTALAGCDDIPYIRYLETPLTTLSLPVEQVCRQAWEILQRRMAEPDAPPSQVLLEATLIKRASSAKRDSRA